MLLYFFIFPFFLSFFLRWINSEPRLLGRRVLRWKQRKASWKFHFSRNIKCITRCESKFTRGTYANCINVERKEPRIFSSLRCVARGGCNFSESIRNRRTSRSNWSYLDHAPFLNSICTLLPLTKSTGLIISLLVDFSKWLWFQCGTLK